MHQRHQVAADYDSIAASWDRTRQQAWGEFDFIEPLIAKSLAQSKKLKVLDAGCGNGRLVHWLDQKIGAGKYDYLGVDASAGLLEHARTGCPGHSFQQADLVDFTTHQKFDLVTCIAVLHHLPSRAEQLAVLQNLHASLAAGGQLFLTVWNLWQPRYLPFVLKSFLTSQPRLCRIPYENRVQRLCYAFTSWQLRALLREAGFGSSEVFFSAGAKCATWWRGRNLVAIARR